MGPSPALLIAIWLLLLGYAVVYVGSSMIVQKPVTLRFALTGSNG